MTEITLCQETIAGMMMFASTDDGDPKWRQLCGVHIAPDHIAATDSYLAARILHDFGEDFTPFTLNTPTLKQIIKNAGKRTPVRFAIDGDTVTAHTTNRDGSLVLPCGLVTEGTFPKVSEIFSRTLGARPSVDTSEPIVALAPAFLVRVGKGAERLAQSRALYLAVGAANKPVHYTFSSHESIGNRDGCILQMPVRMG